MSIQTRDEVPTEQLPSKLDGNFSKFSGTDLWVSVALFAAGVIAWINISIMVWILVVPLWIGLMHRSTNSGRNYYMAGVVLTSFWRVRIRKGKVSEQVDPTVASQAGRKRFGSSRDSSIIPFVTTSVPTDVQDETVGVLHTKRAHTDSSVIVAEGANIVSGGLREQHDAYLRIADVVKRLVGLRRGYSVGVSYVFRKDPFDRFGLLSHLEDFLHNEAVLPSGLDKPEDQLTDEEHRWQLVAGNWSMLCNDLAPRFASKPWMAMTITIRREGILAGAQRSRVINPKQIRRLPINKMVQTAINGLQSAGVTNPRALDKGEIHHFVRGAWDSVTLDEYYESCVEDPGAAYQEGFTGHWPHSEMRVTNRSSMTDGTYTTVLRITGCREEEYQGYWRHLYAGIEAPYFSCALVGSAVRSNRELFALERVHALAKDIGDILGINHRTVNMRKREERLEKRKEDIAASEFSQSYVILIALKGESEDVLDDHVSQVEALVVQLGMSVERITQATLQYPAMWSAATGIPML